jgi:hypothetical protein
MRPALPLLASCLLALAGFAADAPSSAPEAKKPTRQARTPNLIPDSVDGVEAAELAKIRAALIATSQEEAVVAARKRVAQLRERTRFISGRSEAEDLKLDMDKARDEMVKATIAAVQKHDATVSKDSLVLTLNAIEDASMKRGREASQKAREKEEADAKLAKKLSGEGKPNEATAKPADEKPAAPVAALADVEGVSADDMKKFRAAALIARSDPTVKELKAKQTELRKQAEYASADERKGMRGEFEAIMADVHKATLAAILKAAPTLAKDTAEKILETVEARIIAANQKNMQKAATKTPLKPFPFAEKK